MVTLIVMARVVTPAEADALEICVEALRAGEPIVIPTDTVYGLAACANNADAVAQLFALKRRPPDLSIAGLVADAQQAGVHADFATSEPLAQRFWPGPLTLIAPRRKDSDLVIGSDDGTVGLRAPAHQFVRELAQVVGPLAATSANRSGQETLTGAGGIVATFGDAVSVVVDGGELTGLASTVARVDRAGADASVTVFREGAVTHADLIAALTPDC